MADPPVTCDACGIPIPPDDVAHASAVVSPIRSLCAACLPSLPTDQREALLRAGGTVPQGGAGQPADVAGAVPKRSAGGVLASVLVVSLVFWAAVGVIVFFALRGGDAPVVEPPDNEDAQVAVNSEADVAAPVTVDGDTSVDEPTDEAATDAEVAVAPEAGSAVEAQGAAEQFVRVIEMIDPDLSNYQRVVVLLEAFPFYFPETPEAEAASRLLAQIVAQHEAEAPQAEESEQADATDVPADVAGNETGEEPETDQGDEGAAEDKQVVEVTDAPEVEEERVIELPTFTTLGNILENGGFETREAEGRFAAGWKPHRWDKGGGRLNVRVDESNTRSGQHALVVRLIGDVGRAGVYRTMKLEAGEYELSFWATGELDAEALVGAGVGKLAAVSASVGEHWERFSGIVTLLQDQSNVSLRLWSEAPDSRVWFDDVRLCRVSRRPPEAPARDPQAPTRNRNLVAHWTMDDIVDGKVLDCSGNENHGYVRGPEPVTGHFGNALAFGTGTDYVEVPHHRSLDAFPLSITAWVRVLPGGGANAIVNRYRPFSFKNGYELVFTSGVMRGNYIRDNANKIHSPDGFGGVPLDDGEWHHVAAVFDEEGGALYVDTVFVSRIPWTGDATRVRSTRALRMGRYPERGKKSNFKGELDDVRLYARALGAREIGVIAGGAHLRGALPMESGQPAEAATVPPEPEGVPEGEQPRTVNAPCPACAGSGLLKEMGCATCSCSGWLGSKECVNCEGRARVPYPCPGCGGGGTVERGGKATECRYCRGKGSLPCYWCKGSGTVKRPNPEAEPYETVLCGGCAGHGIESKDNCGRCGGKGKIRVQVALPAGLRGTLAYRQVRCPRCDGVGSSPPACPACSGRGYAGAGRSISPCRACSGTGTHFKPCQQCRGSGFTRVPKD